MSDSFIGEIQLFGFNFAPYQWAMCQGQLLPISQNTVLFSLLGTQFGGDGRASFGLPNFQGNAACAQGQGAGLSPRNVGDSFGEPAVTLLATEMPAHGHAALVYNQGDAAKRHGTPLAGDAVISPIGADAFTGNGTTNTAFANGTVGSSGGGQPHANSQPYLALNFCIALNGVFPQRP
ncbi:phage tail protein [Rhodanobacter glycinis]|uniref:Phage tail protein n=1 Tax=Rhodanobacter glycinis TaxID=582702 RepID=A0A5B9DV72_9GAMM|nr:tail fiber protein [Rhodanobacter glycinis]QEE23079.1 phage tail protein [Rhodanobacter glycinis]